MTESQRERVDELFGDLIERDPQEWEAILAGIEDAEVRAEVASLLDHTGPTTKGLNTSIGEMMQAATASGEFEDRSIGPGTRFERYRIERRIGQGGMGDVYEAVRENDFHKRVALKIVRYGLDSDFARGRFQQERQMLAGLEHPFIARLLDGGEAANGCPYLVLEYVDGVPIDVYCQTCSRADILKLFLKVCEAVEYAHRNLIIHRDLKPGNILVTAEGEPKLLDFGIAKLLDPGANVTQTMAIALTPQYASPEQVRGQSITTASDVYSLGVILYQLLTGRKPYAVETTTPFEMERVICQEPAAPPGIGNELDDILMMALRKEPERRYPSVLGLAQDVERFLDGRAVKAAPDSTTYRVRKYVRRHWIGLASTSVAVVALCVGAGVATYQAYLAKQRFQDVRELANTFLFQFNDQIVDIAGTTQARGFVAATAQRYLDKLSKSAGSDVDLQAELAQSYMRLADVQGAPRKANLGDVASAEANYRRATDIYDALQKRHPKYVVNTASAWRQLAFFYLDARRIPEARKAIEHAFTLVEPLKKDGSADALLALATMYQTAGDIEVSTHYSEKDLQDELKSIDYLTQWRRLQQGGDPAEIGSSIGLAHLRIGRSYLDRVALVEADGQIRAAREELKNALALKPQSVHLRRATGSASLSLVGLYAGMTKPNLERYSEAELLAHEAAGIEKSLMDADPKDINARMSYMSALLQSASAEVHGRAGQGTAEVRQAMTVWDDMHRGSGLTLYFRYEMLDELRQAVVALALAGAPSDARELAGRIVQERRGILTGRAADDDDFWYVAGDLQIAAEAARTAGANAEAERLFTEAVRVSEPFAGAADRIVPTAFAAADFYAGLRRDRAATGRCTESAEWQQKEVEVWRFTAATNPYAAMRLQRALAAPDACSRISANLFFD